MAFLVYTDGACRGNPGPGGCAAIIDEGKNKIEVSRGYRWTTNNRMEIRSVIEALQNIPANSAIQFFSDSQYVLNTLSKGWISGWKRKGWLSSTKEPVKNRDLWEELDVLVSRQAMTYQWVRGHASNPLNNRCDEMAVAAALGEELLVDAGYEAIQPFPMSEIPSKAVIPVLAVKIPSQAELPGLFQP